MIPLEGLPGPTRPPVVPVSARATTGSQIAGPSPSPDRDPPAIGGATAGPYVETEPAPGRPVLAGDLDRPAAITRIVVPLDGSDLACRAVPPAEALAARLGASLIFVQAAGPTQVPGLDAALALDLGETDAWLTLQQAKAAAQRKGLRAEAALARGELAARPADAILAVVQRYGAGLVVMATHGRTGARRALLGSVADAVVRRSPVPVLLIPRHYRPPTRGGAGNSDWPTTALLTAAATPYQLPVIIVALDGSHEAEMALPPALSLAHGLGAVVELVRVVPATEPLPGEAASRMAIEESGSYLSGIARRVVAAGFAGTQVRWTTLPARGTSIAEALLAHAAGAGAAMLVMATHARGGLRRLFRGSVESAVVAKATLPVLVVRIGGPPASVAGLPDSSSSATAQQTHP
jgi:nucleotide-binding universal stress UspA family protein